MGTEWKTNIYYTAVDTLATYSKNGREREKKEHKRERKRER